MCGRTFRAGIPAMTQTQGQPKPPPLHERGDVFEEVAESYHGGNDLELVQAGYRGTCKAFIGTAIPKGHDALKSSAQDSAAIIGLENDEIVLDLVEWIDSEKQRAADEAAAKVAEQKSGGASSANAPAISTGLDAPARMDAMH